MSNSEPERFDSMFMAVAQQCEGGIHEVYTRFIVGTNLASGKEYI